MMVVFLWQVFTVFDYLVCTYTVLLTSLLVDFFCSVLSQLLPWILSYQKHATKHDVDIRGINSGKMGVTV